MGDDKSENSYKSKSITKNWENWKKSIGRTPSVLKVHSLIKDLDNIKFSDELLVKKIEDLININDPKVLNFVKNSKVGEDELTMLHVAAKHFRYSVCKLLIDVLKIDPNIHTKSLKTPLHILVKTEKMYEENFGQYEEKFIRCFQLFIEKGCDYNAKDAVQFSVLHYAVAGQNLKAVELLLNIEDLEVSIKNTEGLTPLHYSCKLGYNEISSRLIGKTTVENLTEIETSNKGFKHVNLPIHLVVNRKSEQVDLVVQMLEKVKRAEGNFLADLMYKRVNENQHTILQIAINRGHLIIIEAILKNYYLDLNKFDVNGNLPIHLAAHVGNLSILEILSSYDADVCEPNSKGDYPLHVAAIKNRFNFIKQFLKNQKCLERNKKISGNVVPCIKKLNKDGYTPLFSALLMDHLQSVEVLAADKDCDSLFQDKDGTNSFHICARFNNTESLRFLLKHPRYINNVYLENKLGETPLHIAGLFGNIEIYKMILGKFYDGTLDGRENYLISKDKDGRNSFHLACIEGYVNIVTYLIKDLKLNFLTELVDNSDNTPLHFATMNGHISVVELLLICEPDLEARNIDNLTPLELSCRKQYFDISKILINSIKTGVPFTNRDGFYLLHLAAHEGAHEVVELLLAKGAPIDSINKEGMNALDIAIEQEQHEVIQVLLKDEEWKSLIQHERKVPKVKNSKSGLKTFKKMMSRKKNKPKEYSTENPQLVAMFNHNMWEEYYQILENSYDSEKNHYDFTVLDPPCETTSKHPLMLLAKSGQETLLIHETTNKLLDLKWRYIPRFLYYSSIIFFLTLIVLFALYTIELTNLGFYLHTFDDVTITTPSIILETTADFITNDTNNKEFRHVLKNAPPSVLSNLDNYNSRYTIPILVFVLIDIVKMVFQLVLSDGIKFFLSVINWVEIAGVIFSLLTIFTRNFQVRTQYAAVAILLLFFTFAFLIQKIKVVGIYVLAFQRTLVNSLKFLPLFVIIYLGFLLSFRVLVNSDVKAFNTTDTTAFLTGITVILGDFNTSDFGIESSVLNYILFFSFIIVMAIIILNLLVGIAIGELKQTLDEADIKQISIRIAYVLEIQDALKFTRHSKFLNKIFNMRFAEYNYDTYETKCTKSLCSALVIAKEKLSNQSDIDLVDPQRRLEELITDLSVHNERDNMELKCVVNNQMADVNQKLNNSNQRLEDILLEMSRKTANNFDASADQTSGVMKGVESNIFALKILVKDLIQSLESLMIAKILSNKQSITQNLKNGQHLNTQYFATVLMKLDTILNLDLVNIRSETQSIRSVNKIEFESLKNLMVKLEKRMISFQKGLDKVDEKLNSTQTQVVQTDNKLNLIEILSRKENLSKNVENLRNQQTLRFTPQNDKIKFIEDSFKVVDEKLNKCIDDSSKLDTTLLQLNNLNAKTNKLNSEIDLIKQVESSVKSAENKLNQFMAKRQVLDEILTEQEKINTKIATFEPEMSKINQIELRLHNIDSKQDNLISLLLNALNTKQDKISDSEATRNKAKDDKQIKYKLSKF